MIRVSNSQAEKIKVESFPWLFYTTQSIKTSMFFVLEGLDMECFWMVIFHVFGLKVRSGFESKFSFLFSIDGYLSKFSEKTWFWVMSVESSQ